MKKTILLACMLFTMVTIVKAQEDDGNNVEHHVINRDDLNQLVDHLTEQIQNDPDAISRDGGIRVDAQTAEILNRDRSGDNNEPSEPNDSGAPGGMDSGDRNDGGDNN